MARLGQNRNKNLTRANSIISNMQGGEEETPEVPAVDGIEQPTEEVIPEEVVIPTENNIPPTDVTPPGESAPPVEDTTEVVIPEVTPQVVTDELVFEKLSETLGREVKSYEDLKPKEVQLDEEVKQLLEWKEKTGLSLSKWTDYNKDFSKMSDLDVAKEILAQQYPEFTKEELAYSLKGYIYDELEDDDSDKIKKSIALKKLAKEGRQTLEQNKITLLESQSASSLTQEEVDLINYAKTVKQKEASLEGKGEKDMNLFKEATSKLEAINLNLSDDLVINYKVPQEDKKGLVDYINNMPDWYKEDGSFDHDTIAKDSYKLQNFNSILKAAFEQGKSAGAEGVIKGNNNISLDPNALPQDGETREEGNIKDVVSSITGKNSSRFRFRKSNKQ